MKKIFLTLILCMLARGAFTAPVTAVMYISYNSQRAQAITLLLEQHITQILKNASFATINPGMISREIEKNSCFEETCILRLAENAQIDLAITGAVEERGDYINITLNAFATGGIYKNRMIYSRKIRIPATGNINPREFSLICEENAAFFIAEALRHYLYPSQFTVKNGTASTENIKLSGKYTVYSSSSGRMTAKGEAVIEKGGVVSSTCEIVAGDYILADYSSESEKIESYYTSRKQEIVFGETSFYDTLFIFLTTPLAAASMPFAAPVLGYYTFEDWPGLALWTVNAAPWLYLEARGFINKPEDLRHNHENLSRDDIAANWFAWYMALAGGMSLFMDAYASHYLGESALFIGQKTFLGSNLTAGYLALVSNGGGMFYKGHRGWGYFYFHLNNSLLYMMLRDLAEPEAYDAVSGKYSKGSRNLENALKWGTVLTVSKIIEITHTVLAGTELRSAEIINEYVIPQPLFTFDVAGNPVYGLCVSSRF